MRELAGCSVASLPFTSLSSVSMGGLLAGYHDCRWDPSESGDRDVRQAEEPERGGRRRPSLRPFNGSTCSFSCDPPALHCVTGHTLHRPGIGLLRPTLRDTNDPAISPQVRRANYPFYRLQMQQTCVEVPGLGTQVSPCRDRPRKNEGRQQRFVLGLSRCAGDESSAAHADLCGSMQGSWLTATKGTSGVESVIVPTRASGAWRGRSRRYRETGHLRRHRSARPNTRHGEDAVLWNLDFSTLTPTLPSASPRQPFTHMPPTARNRRPHVFSLLLASSLVVPIVGPVCRLDQSRSAEMSFSLRNRNKKELTLAPSHSAASPSSSADMLSPLFTPADPDDEPSTTESSSSTGVTLVSRPFSFRSEP